MEQIKKLIQISRPVITLHREEKHKVFAHVFTQRDQSCSVMHNNVNELFICVYSDKYLYSRKIYCKIDGDDYY